LLANAESRGQFLLKRREIV